LACGSSDLLMEQKTLVYPPSSLELAHSPSSTHICSLVDVLVCTPGRLLEHLQSTEYFTLQHLRYLILDEADRLLGNAFDHWVRSLVSSTTAASDVHHYLRLHTKVERGGNGAIDQTSRNITSTMLLRSLLCGGSDRGIGDERVFSENRIQRLLFSATLTDNPRKLALSGVRNPLIIRCDAEYHAAIASSQPIAALASTTEGSGVSEPVESASALSSLPSDKYTLPQKLKEWMCISDASMFPLHLITIIMHACGLLSQLPPLQGFPPSPLSLTDCCRLEGDVIIIFTSSVETTHRLCRMLQLFNNQIKLDGISGDKKSGLVLSGEVREVSRLVSARERSEALQGARGAHQGGSDTEVTKAVKVLVSSDQLARGIDLGNIRLVINYDLPSHPRTYVHRVGRTARANKSGNCVTLVKKGRQAEFTKLRDAVDHRSKEVSRVKLVVPEAKVSLNNETTDSHGKINRTMQELYESALSNLGIVLQLEADNVILPGQCE
jgi:ATP-dependent RNA helicase DDX51/DBP6